MACRGPWALLWSPRGLQGTWKGRTGRVQGTWPIMGTAGSSLRQQQVQTPEWSRISASPARPLHHPPRGGRLCRGRLSRAPEGGLSAVVSSVTVAVSKVTVPAPAWKGRGHAAWQGSGVKGSSTVSLGSVLVLCPAAPQRLHQRLHALRLLQRRPQRVLSARQLALQPQHLLRSRCRRVKE